MTPVNQTECIRLRPMRLSDVNHVEEIDRLSFPTPWPKAAFLYELKGKRRSVCWVAEWIGPGKDSLVVGSIVIWLVLDEAHIATLAVRPEYRRRHIAQRLISRALIECMDAGAEQALLEVRESNSAAQQLYSKFGFLVVGRRRDYYKDRHEDAILMTLAPLDREKLVTLVEQG